MHHQMKNINEARGQKNARKLRTMSLTSRKWCNLPTFGFQVILDRIGRGNDRRSVHRWGFSETGRIKSGPSHIFLMCVICVCSCFYVSAEADQKIFTFDCKSQALESWQTRAQREVLERKAQDTIQEWLVEVCITKKGLNENWMTDVEKPPR